MGMLAEALKVTADRGFHIFPVTTPSDGGENAGKRPLVRRWPELATTAEATIREWWTTRPDANIGIATGVKSGVFVLDVDPKNGGFESLEQFIEEVGAPLHTLAVKTGSGGRHFYFRYDPSRPISNSNSKLGPGLDIRGEGGYVVAPPSLHASGNRYEWIA
jgi:putative DNA primase/helicase